MHTKEKIYLACPVFAQNILVSLYGWIEHHRRYGRACDALYLKISENEFDDREQLALKQNASLQKMLQHARSTVDFYQNIRTNDLDNFPVVNRSDVFDHPERFVSSNYRSEKLLKLYTGGSTGTPLTIYMTRLVRQQTYAFWKLFYQQIGFNIGDKKASFVGRKIQQPDNNNAPFWRYNAIDRQLIFSSYHLDTKNIPTYLAQLNKFKPVIIEGYPLSILRLAEYIIDHNTTLTFVPKGISTSSENFTDKQRKLMEKAFSCKVYDQYGSAESVVFASECEYQSKHVAPEYGLIEVLQKDGSISRSGEGELLMTGLLNDAMPLIRYRIGDLARISQRDCPCGRKSSIIEELYGKSGAVIVSEDKTIPTAAIAIAFEYLKNVKKSQLVQNEPNKVIARLATTDDFSEKEESFMRWELQKMLGENMKITVEKVDDIPPAANGKYQMVVQNYYKNTTFNS